MRKRTALLIAGLILSGSVSEAQIRVSRRSNYTQKFLVLKKLVKLSESRSEKIAVSALNQLREVLFRSENLLNPEMELESQPTLGGLVNRMNNDVDRVYEAMFNLENTIDVANLEANNDLQLLGALKTMILEEIKAVLGSSVFLENHEKLSAKILSFKNKWNLSRSDSKFHNLQALDNHQKVLDLAWYLYAEQSQWLMSTAFYLECLDFTNFRKQNSPDSPSKLRYSKPPRMFILGEPADYNLEDENF